MRDNRARLSVRKLSLVAPLVIGALIAAVLAFVWLSGEENPPTPEPSPPPLQPAPPTPPIPPPQVAQLTRRDLIAEAEAIAQAQAGGEPRAAGSESLVGRQFRIAISFGCDGPQNGPGAAQAHYEFDPVSRTLRLTARPIDWTTLPLVQQSPDSGQIEAVEGFWIPRPWVAEDACPPRDDRPAPVTPTPPAAQTLGLAQVFTAGSSRLSRRSDRPYQYVQKLASEDPLPLNKAYELVLEGRVAAWPDGRAVRCWSESAYHRPLCLYAVEMQEVSFQDPGSTQVLAEWRP